MNDVTSNEAADDTPAVTRYTLWQLVRYMLGLGTWGFGYLFTILPAPYFKKHGKRPAIVAFVDGVTAAAIGAITGAVILIGQRSITDWVTAAMALLTVAVLWRFKKLPEPAIVLVAALIGLAVHPLMTHG